MQRKKRRREKYVQTIKIDMNKIVVERNSLNPEEEWQSTH